MRLGIDEGLLSACVQCGLCLPHCPTYRATGDEALSPRGRIRLIREVQHHDLALTAEVERALDTCVQCRGCEPACPSQVRYGELIEQARSSTTRRHRLRRVALRLALVPVTRPRLLAALTRVLAVGQRARLVPERLGLPARLPLRERPLAVPTPGTRRPGRRGPAGMGDTGAQGRPTVLLFTGCVMDAWQRDVHQAAANVLAAAGFDVVPTGPSAPCCGALHAHAGLVDEAHAIGAAAASALQGDAPVVVDSAGCGAVLKELGAHLGTPAAIALSARVSDLHEFLAAHAERLPRAAPLDLRVAVHDPCHLRHVQRAHGEVRAVLGPYVRELAELDDDGVCCGAGGAYSVRQPALARQVRDRKLAAVSRAGADVVVSANPGCSMFLTAGGAETVHPIQLVDRALAARRPT